MDFSQGMGQALAIWLALLAAVLVTFLILTLLSRRGHGGPSWWARLRKAVRDPEAAKERQAKAERSAAAIAELERYTEEVAVAAGRATVMADRRRGEWEAAQRTQEAAWRAFEQTEAGVRRLRQASAFPLVEDDPAIRRRHLVRIVNQAHERGEISAVQLADALMGRHGWDPAAHPFEQELTLRKMIRDRKFQAYQEASEIERIAAKAADLAMAAKRSLDDEAFDAQLRLRKATRPEVPAPSLRTVPVR
ncbi:hypothetical protein KZZ52_54670 [Dactylosporangium sp. AC04546]|uniref:hypothetical protein n=1 Tax=Dactylosporangium sp. AC04546 TaxID=2862460 RepID=UPI001EE0D69F|nr:hypothetical protein [Dactylosporangium sp. AC04546]WVK82884.1 hypothetical protein KZZ52_54670 [Dactylosporangium sp. AC04546]